MPPLVLLFYYHHRVLAAPPLTRLLLLFVVGAVSGLVALDLESRLELALLSCRSCHRHSLESLAWVMNWEQMTHSLPGAALRQLLEVGPIEEGSKLAGVVLFQGSRPKRTSSIFLFTIAIVLGFTAEENWVYLANGASILDRLIGTPVHAMLSAPWGYALGLARRSRFRLSEYRGVIVRAWLNAVICHALVNVLSIAWRYSQPIHWLGYGLFPFLLWMFWRLESLLARSQSNLMRSSCEPPPHGVPCSLTLAPISVRPRLQYYWRLGLALFAIVLGGNAIFGLFLLVRSLSALNPSQIFTTGIEWFIASRCGLSLILGLIAIGIYFYLKASSNR